MKLPVLHTFKPKIRKTENGTQIFDPCRKKYIALTPEEKVRQYFLHYLIHIRNISANLIATEFALKINELNKRADIVVFSKEKKLEIMVECKAPDISLDENVINQILIYNSKIQAKKLIITNGNDFFEFEWKENCYKVGSWEL